MKIQKIEDRILYSPNINEGDAIFDGIPHASIEILNLIGREGIQYIDQKLKSFVSQRIEMYGTENVKYFGLEAQQRFFDMQEQVAINVKRIIDDPLDPTADKKENYTIALINQDSVADLAFQDFITRENKKGIDEQIKYIKAGLLS